MSRAIRTGSVYHCGSGTLTTMQPCSTGATQFAFLSAAGQTTVYALNTTSCANGIGCIVRSTDAGATYLPITSPDIIITSLQFYVRGVAGNTQPQVSILLSGYITLKGTQQTPFNVETSVTQRIYGQ
jgi:hypothetical protein